MKIVLTDNGLHKRFAPLTLTRPVGDLRIGIFTNTERWQKLIDKVEIFYETETYLQGKYPASDQPDVEINACLIPTKAIAQVILSLPANSTLKFNDLLMAKKGSGSQSVEWKGENPLILTQRWHLYQYNDLALKIDFQIVTEGRKSQPLSPTNTLIGDLTQVFIEEGATIEASTLNTKTGPIYVGKDAEIMEGCIVRGGLAMGEHSTMKLGTKVYGAVTLGRIVRLGERLIMLFFSRILIKVMMAFWETH